MFARYASAVTTGTLMTCALLYAMQGLIHLQPGAESEPRPRTIVDWINLPRQPSPPPPPTPDYDKETIMSAPIPPAGRPTGKPGPGIYNPVRASAPPPGNTRPGRIGDPDGPLIAIVRVQPTYPAPAQARGIEGWVDVSFDVMTSGQVTNIQVTGSSHGVFEKSALQAAQKFRFRAPVVDGAPQVATNVNYRFRFEMQN